MTVYGTEFFSRTMLPIQDPTGRYRQASYHASAATRLEISDWYCRRLLERYCENGPRLAFKPLQQVCTQMSSFFGYCNYPSGPSPISLVSDVLLSSPVLEPP